LVVEVYQTLQAIKSRENIFTSKVYLTGQITKIVGFNEFFSHEIRVPVQHWPIFTGFNREGDVKLTPTKERSFAVSLALAHRYGIKKPHGWLNFRRSTQATTRPLTGFFQNLLSTENRPVVFGILGFILFLYLYAFIVGMLTDKKIENLKSDVRAELRILDPNVLSTAEKIKFDYENTKKIVMEKSKQLAADRAPREKFVFYKPRVEILQAVSKSRPPGGILTSLEITNLTFRGEFTYSKPTNALLENGALGIKNALSTMRLENIQTTIKSPKVIFSGTVKGEK